MIYTFENFTLDVERRQLRRDDGETVALRPKVYSLLLFLLQHPDKVLSKSEVLDVVWPKRFVSDATLNSCLKELRKGLDDTGPTKRFIKTVHGVGFRFIAAVSDAPLIVSDPSETEAAEDERILPSQPFAAEKKVVSALCYRLKSELSIDPEEAYASTRSALAKIDNIVRRWEGSIAQEYSNGGLAVFGATSAQDDHARRAVNAAEELLDQLSVERNPSWPTGCCAVASGQAIVESDPGALTPRVVISGEPVQTSEALCTIADAQTCVLSAESYGLVRADVRATILPEVDGAWILDSTINQKAGVPRQFRRNLSPHVGRDLELSILRQAVDSQGQCIAVFGSAGIGKTRLLEEFVADLDASITCIELACSPQTQNTPYAILIALLSEAGNIGAADSAEQKSKKLSTLASLLGAESEDAADAWQQLFNTPLSVLNSSDKTPESIQHSIDSFCAQTLSALGQRVVLLVEDVHWIDPSSKRLLSMFAERLASQSVMLVLTSRPVPATEWVSQISETRLTLRPLADRDCLHILRALPQADAISAKHNELIEVAAGNPFFLGELAFHVQAKRKQIPDNVHSVIATRIDTLKPADKELLQLVATLGSQTTFQLLLGVTKRSAVSLESALLRLQHAELLYLDGNRDDSNIFFKHALIQDVAYNSQLSERKKQVHSFVARGIETELPDLSLTHPELLAEHFTSAGENAIARIYWQRAAYVAKGHLAYAEALRFTQAGLELLPADNLTKDELESKLSLLRIHCDALMAAKGYTLEEIDKIFAEIKLLCRTLDDQQSLFQVLTQERQYQLIVGNNQAVSIANRALLSIARRTNDNNTKVAAKVLYSAQLIFNNRLPAAERCLRQCLVLLGELGDQQFVNLELHVRVNSQLAWVCINSSREAEALAFTAAAMDAANKSGAPFVVANALAMAAELHRLRRDPETALQLANECIELSGKESLPFWLTAVNITLGWAMCIAQGDRKGIPIMEDTIALFERKGMRVRLSDYLAALADVYLHFGDLDKVAATLESANDWNAKQGNELTALALSRLKGRLAQAQQQIEQDGFQ